MLYLQSNPKYNVAITGGKILSVYRDGINQYGLNIRVMNAFETVYEWVLRNRPDLRSKLASSSARKQYGEWMEEYIRRKGNMDKTVHGQSLNLYGDILFPLGRGLEGEYGDVPALVSVKDLLEAIGEYIGFYSSLPDMRVLLYPDGVLERQVLLDREKDRWDTISMFPFVPEKEVENARNAYNDFYVMLNGINEFIQKEEE